MPLSSHLSFIGYDEPAAAVLLKSSLGDTYTLAPTLGLAKSTAEGTKQDRNCCVGNPEEGTARINANAEEDEGKDYTESICSASYISSASSSASFDNTGDHPEEALGDEQHIACCESLSSHAIDAPVHGAVLCLKPQHSSSFLAGNVPQDEMELYTAPVVLGYDAHDSVFLLPSPQLITEPSPDDMCSYRRGPLLQLTVATMLEHYTCAERIPSPAPPLPLHADLMQCPLLDKRLLCDVFDVDAEAVYHFSLWSSRVRFVGVAWGMPWVQVLSGPLSIQPLAQCHDRRTLREYYGLRRVEEEEEICERTSGGLGQKEAEGPDCTLIHCTTEQEWQRTSQRRRSRLTSPPFFIRGNSAVCRDPLGTNIECCLLPSVLAPFRVSHGERLRGIENTAFSGREGIVLGVHVGSLVLLMDGDDSTTILHNVADADALLKLFVPLRDGTMETSAEGFGIPGGNALKGTTKGLNVERVTEREGVRCINSTLSPAPNESESKLKETLCTNISVEGGGGFINSTACENVENSHVVGEDGNTVDPDSDDNDEGETLSYGNATAHGVQMKKLHFSDDNAQEIQTIKENEEVLSPGEQFSSSELKNVCDVLNVHTASGDASDQCKKSNPVNGWERSEDSVDEITDDARDSLGSEKAPNEESLRFTMDVPNVDSSNERASSQKEEGKTPRGAVTSSGHSYIIEAENCHQHALTNRATFPNNMMNDSPSELEESSGDSPIRSAEPIHPVLAQAQLQNSYGSCREGNVSVNDRPHKESLREQQKVESRIEKFEEISAASPSGVTGTTTNSSSITANNNNNKNNNNNNNTTSIRDNSSKDNTNGIVESSCISNGIGEASTSERSSAQNGPMNTSPFFTDFLKAFAYWRMGVYTTRAQQEQPLLFVQFYEVDTYRRMMDAMEVLQRHYKALSTATEKQLTIKNIVQILVEREDIPLPL